MAEPSSPSPDEDYSQYVNHPRYGRGPRLTGLNPKHDSDEVHLHWMAISREELKARWAKLNMAFPDWEGDTPRQCRRIPSTAVVADLERQTPATIPVTHYFDLARVCRYCNRPFIFFADQQKYWYEELGFSLNSDCVGCSDCRKENRKTAQLRKTYEALVNVENRGIEQNLQMANACLTLIEAHIFPPQKTQTVRMLLNSLRKDGDALTRSQVRELQNRLEAVEQEMNDRPGN